LAIEELIFVIPAAFITASKSVLRLLAAMPKPAEPAMYIPCANADVEKSAADKTNTERINLLDMEKHLFLQKTKYNVKMLFLTLQIFNIPYYGIPRGAKSKKRAVFAHPSTNTISR
jgi:hypothetical protein